MPMPLTLTPMPMPTPMLMLMLMLMLLMPRTQSDHTDVIDGLDPSLHLSLPVMVVKMLTSKGTLCRTIS